MANDLEKGKSNLPAELMDDYCLLLGNDGMFQPVIIDMKSTQLKVSRRWKTQIAMQKIKAPDGQLKTPALFATIWKFTTIEESNDMGSWFNWSIPF